MEKFCLSETCRSYYVLGVRFCRAMGIQIFGLSRVAVLWGTVFQLVAVCSLNRM